ncbi:hypothetical protein FQU23_012800 [Flavobacterium sp. XN-5]|uniref:hypothetical protein n=1 Tax=Flavobacterium sp. XN-5 TaxID=2599390 RepID=UPI0011C81BA6|nr:hypothetical protein [Flavobacterium sp. XN-5]NGY38386.1 hypothetical protein [Flavobacterium sp. XN-5]
MTRKIKTIPITLFFMSIGLISCKKTDDTIKASIHSTFEVNNTVKTTELSQHDYKVVGTDENGENVHGNINIEGKIGVGYLTTTNATNIEVVAEWINKHTLLATDLEGFEYTLTTK